MRSFVSTQQSKKLELLPPSLLSLEQVGNVAIQVIKVCIGVLTIAYFNSIVTTSSSRKLFLLARSTLCFGPKQTNEMDKGPLIENSSYLNEFSIRFDCED
jgi:hypothetical protein